MKKTLPEIHYRTNRDEAYGLMEDLADLGFVTEVVNDGNVYAVVVGDHYQPKTQLPPPPAEINVPVEILRQLHTEAQPC